MSGRREDAAWDGGPPGAEREQGPQPMFPNRGNVKMAYPSYSQCTLASNTPYMNSGDDFLYATPKQSDYFPGPPMNYAHDGKRGNDSYSRSRSSPLRTEGRSDSRSRKKYRKSHSKSPKRRFRKSRSRSSSKGKKSGRYERNSKSFHERRSHDRSPYHKGRKFKKRSSSSSSSSERSKSLTDENSKKNRKDNKSKNVPKKDKFNISKRSRSQSTETSSSSNSSSTSEKSFTKYDYRTKGGNKRENHSNIDRPRITKNSPEFQENHSNIDRSQTKTSPEFPQQMSHPNRETREIFSYDYKNVNGTAFFNSPHIPQSQTLQPTVEKPEFNYQLPVAAQFRNDGSFLEMFKKIQESQKAQEISASTSTGSEASKSDVKKTALPLVGKRRGGRVLKTGVVKKPKSIEEQTVDSAPTDAWSLYLKEVKKYKDSSCDEECKMRPLFK